MEPEKNNQPLTTLSEQPVPARPPELPLPPLTAPTASPPGLKGPAVELFKNDNPETFARRPLYKTMLSKISRDKRLVTLVIVISILFLGGTVFGLFTLQQQFKKSEDIVSTYPDSASTETGSDTTAEAKPEPSPAPAPAPAPPPSSSTTSAPNSSSAPAPSAPPATTQRKTYTVSYTTDCYSPSSLTVKAGDTVLFKNNTTNKNMYPASDDHPSHKVYSNFDAGKDIAPGQTYLFTPTRIGTWGYHDHNKPNCKGVITVN